jgi:hypothetical protein
MLEEGQLKYWRDQQWSRVSVGKDGKRKYSSCGKKEAQDNPERCKPKKKWQSMSSNEIKYDKTKKKQGGKKGKQFIPASKKGKVSGDYIKEQHDYKGLHKAPKMEYGAPIWDLTINDVYSDDVYDKNAIQYYGDGDYYDIQMFHIIMQYRNKPNEKIKIYRGIPKFMTKEKKLVKELTNILKEYKETNGMFLQYHDSIPEFKLWDDLSNQRLSKRLSNQEYDEKLKVVKEVIVKSIQEKLKEIKKSIQKFKINHGDWVTPSRQYAKKHASKFDEGYEILTAEVYARDIFTDGSSWVEWGYDPQPPIQIKQNVSESSYSNENYIEIIPLNETYEPNLKRVIDMMKKKGSPTIKAYFHGAYNMWVALNGSHRIVAAKILNLPIILEEYDYDEIYDKKLSDFTELESDDMTIEELNDTLNSLDLRRAVKVKVTDSNTYINHEKKELNESHAINEKAGVSEWMETKADEIMDMYEKHKRDEYTTENFFEYADLKFEFGLNGVNKLKEFEVDIEVISTDLKKVVYDGNFKQPNKIIINIKMPYHDIINKVKELKASSLNTKERFSELQRQLEKFHEKRKKIIKSLLIHELNHMYSFHKGYKSMLDKNYAMSNYFKRGVSFLSNNSEVMKIIGNLMYITHPAERTAQIISTVIDPDTHQYPVKWIKKAIEFNADYYYQKFKTELEQIGIKEEEVLKDLYFYLRNIGYQDKLLLKLIHSHSISLYELFKKFEKEFNRRGIEMYKKLKKYEYLSKE